MSKNQAKRKTRKQLKLKTRKTDNTNNATKINIKIDNSKRTQARKSSTEQKLPKGHINLPITYYQQYQPARTVITEQIPSNSNLTDLYATQFKNYFDGKLSGIEKTILEQSEKKNTAPPKPSPPDKHPGAYDTISDYDDNLIYQSRIRTKQDRIRPSLITELSSSDYNVPSSTIITEQKFLGFPRNAQMPIPYDEKHELDDPMIAEVLDENKIIDEGILERNRQAKENELLQKEDLITKIFEARQKLKDNDPYFVQKSYADINKFTVSQLEKIYKQTYKPPEFFENRQKQKQQETQQHIKNQVDFWNLYLEIKQLGKLKYYTFLKSNYTFDDVQQMKPNILTNKLKALKKIKEHLNKP